MASTAVNKNYDLGTLIGDTSYTVDAFTLSPSGSIGTITYTDVSSITGVAFDTSSRTFTWPTLGTGTYTLKMQGSLTGLTSITTSFKVTITQASPTYAISSNSPPYFDPVLPDIALNLGKVQVYKFP